MLLTNNIRPRQATGPYQYQEGSTAHTRGLASPDLRRWLSDPRVIMSWLGRFLFKRAYYKVVTFLQEGGLERALLIHDDPTPLHLTDEGGCNPLRPVLVTQALRRGSDLHMHR